MRSVVALGSVVILVLCFGSPAQARTNPKPVFSSTERDVARSARFFDTNGSLANTPLRDIITLAHHYCEHPYPTDPEVDRGRWAIALAADLRDCRF